ncbi:MAG: TSUP family transporter [Gemmatimonadales bacterium]
MLFLVIGLVAGVLAGFFGIGGGVVIVPALMLLARFSPTKASGTSLAALLLPVGALGAWEYFRNGELDLRAAAAIALGLFLGAWAGAHWANQVPIRYLQRGFSVFLLAIAAHLWWTA